MEGDMKPRKKRKMRQKVEEKEGEKSVDDKILIKSPFLSFFQPFFLLSNPMFSGDSL